MSDNFKRVLNFRFASLSSCWEQPSAMLSEPPSLYWQLEMVVSSEGDRWNKFKGES